MIDPEEGPDDGNYPGWRYNDGNLIPISPATIHMDILLGLDLGTTNCKALAMDADGVVVASASAPTPEQPPSPATAGSVHGSPTYDAEALWQEMASLIRQIQAQLAGDQRIAALAVASMAEAGVLVDGVGEPLAPVLTWHDRRTVPWVRWWQERMTEPEIYAITGLPLDYIYSVNKLFWYRSEDPQTFARAQTWLSLSDWIVFRLTGERTTDYSMASRTMLFDLSTRSWSEDLLVLSDLPAGLMPPAFASGQVIGEVTAGAARLTGLMPGTPVVSGGHDHICAALAADVIAPGPVLNSSGTAETILSALETPILNERAARSGLCCGCHTARDRYYLVGGFLGGAVVNWLVRLPMGDGAPDALTTLLAEAEQAPVLADGAWFLPYLGGSGPPARDPDAWGAWLGLRLHHRRGHLVRAALEGLSFALRHLLDGLQQITGETARSLHTVGGGGRSAWRNQLKADVLGVPVEVPVVSEYTARGAALLAGIGIGIYADDADAAARTKLPNDRFEPNLDSHTRYDAAYHNVFLKLYPALQELPLTDI